MNEPWKIKTRSTVCAESGRHFAEGEHFYAALFENPEDEAFTRKDFSEDAWKKVGESLNPYSFWRTKFEAPPPPQEKDVVQKQTAETLLRQLFEEDLPATENARYILAVMLERKKILIQVETKPIKRGGRLLIYERHKTGEVFIVKDPQLKLEEIESVQEEVSSLLGGDKKKKEEKEDAEENETGEETTAEDSKAESETRPEETPQEVS